MNSLAAERSNFERAHLSPTRTDDHVTVIQVAHHLWNDIGRIGGIGVDHDHVASFGSLDTGRPRGAIAPVVRMSDHLEPEDEPRRYSGCYRCTRHRRQ